MNSPWKSSNEESLVELWDVILPLDVKNRAQTTRFIRLKRTEALLFRKCRRPPLLLSVREAVALEQEAPQFETLRVSVDGHDVNRLHPFPGLAAAGTVGFSTVRSSTVRFTAHEQFSNQQDRSPS